MDKELPFVTVTPPSQLAGFLSTMQELWAVLSNFLEPDQVLEEASTAMPTVVLALEVPPGPQWPMDFVADGAFATLVNDQVLIYTPESKEAVVCEFFA